VGGLDLEGGAYSCLQAGARQGDLRDDGGHFSFLGKAKFNQMSNIFGTLSQDVSILSAFLLSPALSRVEGCFRD